MFILGSILFAAVTAGVGAWLGTRRTPRRIDHPWDIPRVAQTFTTIVGTLAGFSVASAIFVANLTVARESPEFASLIGMFLLAFILFVATAQEFGTTPNLPNEDDAHTTAMRFGYLLAMTGYFLALTLSWNALRLLLLAIGLHDVAEIFRWILLFVVVTGAARLSIQHVYLMTRVARSSTLLVPISGFLAAGLYRLVIVPAVDWLRPPANEPLIVGVLCFAVGACGFLLQSGLLASRSSARATGLVVRSGEPVVVGFVATVTFVAGLLWAAVALA